MELNLASNHFSYPQYNMLSADGLATDLDVTNTTWNCIPFLETLELQDNMLSSWHPDLLPPS